MFITTTTCYFTVLFISFFESLCLSRYRIKINYIGRDGTKMTVNGVVGDSLLDVAIDNDLDIEGYGRVSHCIVFCLKLYVKDWTSLCLISK